MMLTENIRQAYNSLMINAKRTVLTMIGIVIGLSSVLFITSIGDTIVNVLDEFLVQTAFGGVSVYCLSGNNGEKFVDDFQKYTFTRDEIYDFIDENSDLILDIDGSVYNDIKGTVNIDKNHKSKVSLKAVSSSYEYTNKLRIVAGRFLSKDECRLQKPVAVISDVAAEECFGSAESAIGKMIDMSGILSEYGDYNPETYQHDTIEKPVNVGFTVVGVYKYVSKGMMDMFTFSTTEKGETELYSPYSYITDKFDINSVTNFRGKGESLMMHFIIKDEKSAAEAEEKICEFAEAKYGSDPNYDYSIENSVEDLKDVKKTVMIVTYAFALIGAISLLVGGIGLMNTMLVSVTERTKEIGIKKALGAKTSTIRLQFLTESAFLCLASCAIGIFFGFLFGMIVETNLDKLMALIKDESLRYFLENTTIHVTPSLGSIIFSSVFSILVGVVFGYYPANKGAKMQPVDALRYE